MQLLPTLFENDVKEYGIQTYTMQETAASAFENDVKEYGIQTLIRGHQRKHMFENDVKEYGIQTQHYFSYLLNSLRMM